MMRFEGRDLPPYLETVPRDSLVEGELYFSVHYCGDQLTLPVLLSLVFVGQDLVPGDSGEYYFQDLESYVAGHRFGDGYDDAADNVPAPQFHHGDIVKSIQTYEQAIDELLRCALRRQTASKSSTSPPVQ